VTATPCLRSSGYRGREPLSRSGRSPSHDRVGDRAIAWPARAALLECHERHRQLNCFALDSLRAQVRDRLVLAGDEHALARRRRPSVCADERAPSGGGSTEVTARNGIRRQARLSPLCALIGNEQSGSPAAIAGLIRSAGRMTPAAARGTHECFQGRLRLVYSRFHDGRPSPSQNREWRIPSARESLGQQSPNFEEHGGH
jgi:hypothetical protein